MDAKALMSRMEEALPKQLVYVIVCSSCHRSAVQIRGGTHTGGEADRSVTPGKQSPTK